MVAADSIAADLLGEPPRLSFPGVVQTAITKFCSLEISRTGLGEQQARDAGFDPVVVSIETTNFAGYMPDAGTMTVLMVADRAQPPAARRADRRRRGRGAAHRRRRHGAGRRPDGRRRRDARPRVRAAVLVGVEPGPGRRPGRGQGARRGDSRVGAADWNTGDASPDYSQETACPSPHLRSTPRCSTRPRASRSPTRPSTSRPRRRSTPRSPDSPRPRATASSRCRPAAPSTSPAPRSRTWSPARWPSPPSPQEVAKKYPVNVALHTDHCPKDKLDGFVRPLIAPSAERVKAGGLPYFQSHMWDGSAVPLEENLEIAQELLAACAAANIILEVEIGVVGGEEDGVEGGIGEQALHDPRGRAGHRRRARPRREGPLPDGADVRQRARRLQARQRQAAPRDPQGRAGGRRREVRQGRAVRPGVPRRLGLAARGDLGAPSTTASSR